MGVDSITAICAIIIALASLVVTVMEARTTREHNRQSVRPVLRIVRVKMHDDTRTGLKIENLGLGPAVILSTAIELDGKPIGAWNRKAFDLMVGTNKPLPNFSAIYDDAVIPAGSTQFLIFIDPFKERQDSWFWELIAHRLTLEVRYESLYGGENFTTFKRPREPGSGTLLLSVACPSEGKRVWPYRARPGHINTRAARKR
jgi:hypothetical protein